jgi:hypothetical protein
MNHAAADFFLKGKAVPDYQTPAPSVRVAARFNAKRARARIRNGRCKNAAMPLNQYTGNSEISRAT